MDDDDGDDDYDDDNNAVNQFDDNDMHTRWFGWSVSLDGRTMAIGARNSDEYRRLSATGRRLNDDDHHEVGGVFVLTRDGYNKWRRTAVLLADGYNGDDDDKFGHVVVLDGIRLLATAPFDNSPDQDDDDNDQDDTDDQEGGGNVGSVYIYYGEKETDDYDYESYDDGNSFDLEFSNFDYFKIEASDGRGQDFFGWSADLDGYIIAVGAPFSDLANVADQGSVYIYRESDCDNHECDWKIQQKVYSPDPEGRVNFGWSLSLDDGMLAVGAPKADLDFANQGAVYVYQMVGYENDDDESYGDDFDLDDEEWIDVDDDQVDVWVLVASLYASDAAANDWFGWSVGLDVDSGFLAIGAPQNDELNTIIDDDDNDDADDDEVKDVDVGAVYIFQLNDDDDDDDDSVWTQIQKIYGTMNFADNDHYGYALAIDGDNLVISGLNEHEHDIQNDDFNVYARQLGAYQYDDESGIFEFVDDMDFRLDNHDDYLDDAFVDDDHDDDDDGGESDAPGFSVAIDGDWIAIGAPFDSKGKVYVFYRKAEDDWRLACPSGTSIDNDNSNDCDGCSPGKYNDQLAEYSCDLCPPGTYSGSDAAYCTSCTGNQYSSNSGSSSCSTCSGGRYTDNVNCYDCGYNYYGNGQTCTVCPDGTWTNGNTAQTSCSGCGVGYYASGGSDCAICPKNTYGSVGGGVGSCSNCPAGSETDGNGEDNVNDCYDCVGGYSSSGGDCSTCAAGKYSSTTSGASCLLCDAGKSSSSGVENEYNCLDCIAGEYSANDGDLCVNCPAGRYSTSDGSSTCTYCPAGSSSDAGSNDSGDCSDCGAGFYADGSSCAACPENTYGSAAGGVASCTSCSAGKDTNNLGTRTSSAACVDCDAGDYSNSGEDCQACPKNTYNPTAGLGFSGCLTCSNGMSTSSLTGQTACTSCSGGYYAVGGNDCAICPKNTYGSNTGVTSCTNCPAGCSTASLTGQDDVSGCTDCVGGYSSSGGDCSTCAAGKYSTTSSGASCLLCSAGKSSSSGVENAASCNNCAAGKYSANDGDLCSTCGNGKYSAEGSSGCTNCDTGKYGSIPASGDCTDCAEGEYNPSLGQTSCMDCDVGRTSISTQGSSACTNCLPGTYNDEEGGVCMDCGSGTFSNDEEAMECEDCSAGSFADEDGANECELCPVGSYSGFTGQETCSVCSKGKHQSNMGQTSCVACAMGYYGPSAGMTDCTACPAGKYSTKVGATSWNGCTICVNGKYSAAGSSACTNCPSGKYGVKAGAAVGECASCAAGKAQEYPGKTFCTACVAGKYASAGTAVCSTCGTGKYSASGAAACTDCPDGFWSPTGSKSSSACVCPTGYTKVGTFGCFNMVNTKVSFTSATNACGEGASLAQFGSRSALNAAASQVCGTTRCWVGGKKAGGVSLWVGGDMDGLTIDAGLITSGMDGSYYSVKENGGLEGFAGSTALKPLCKYA